MGFFFLILGGFGVVFLSVCLDVFLIFLFLFEVGRSEVGDGDCVIVMMICLGGGLVVFGLFNVSMWGVGRLRKGLIFFGKGVC